MKYLDEYRDAEGVRRLAEALRRTVTRPWKLMEVCGGQTHSIVRFGLDQLLPPEVELIHGPGCPVCVTPLEQIDKALAIAALPDVIFCTFGDMLRVPGSSADLFFQKSRGSDVRVVYSPLDAVRLAKENPEKQVVFFAVGFETTAPGNALSVVEAERQGLDNFSLLVSHVLVPPALSSILQSPDCAINGILAAGHVCTIMGTSEYGPLAEKHQAPIVVTGFEPVDLMQGVLMLVQQLESGRAEVENAYGRVVRPEGNTAARDLIQQVFEVTDRRWRGIGEIPQSGWGLRERYHGFDANRRFSVEDVGGEENPHCQSGLVLLGKVKPPECPMFGKGCSPENPLGATMVSSEGACAAYFHYRREEAAQ